MFKDFGHLVGFLLRSDRHRLSQAAYLILRSPRLRPRATMIAITITWSSAAQYQESHWLIGARRGAVLVLLCGKARAHLLGGGLVGGSSSGRRSCGRRVFWEAVFWEEGLLLGWPVPHRTHVDGRAGFDRHVEMGGRTCSRAAARYLACSAKKLISFVAESNDVWRRLRSERSFSKAALVCGCACHTQPPRVRHSGQTRGQLPRVFIHRVWKREGKRGGGRAR